VSVLVDTGVWFAYLHEDDRRREEAEAILHACVEGRHGRIVTTHDIVVETLTLLMAREAPWSAVEGFAGLVGLRSDPALPQIATVLGGRAGRFAEAWPLFERHYEEKELGFTDCTTVVAMGRRGIDKVASFDDDLDGLVDRVSG
jgi:predicted nucleic acid-binding protein